MSFPHIVCLVVQTFASCLTAEIVKWALAYNIVSLVANTHFTISAFMQHERSVFAGFDFVHG